jgi:hypothetical protein
VRIGRFSKLFRSDWAVYGLGAGLGLLLTIVEESADSTGQLGLARLSVYVVCLSIAGASRLVTAPVRPLLFFMGLAPAFVLAVAMFFAWLYPLHFAPLAIMFVGFAISAKLAGNEARQPT